MIKGKNVVLGLLNKSERTGYEINEFFQKIFYHFYDGSLGMIYPTLRKLEEEGKIEKKQVIQSDRPNKNVFTINDSGKEEFHKYLNSPVEKERRVSDFLMRMYFGEYIDKEKIEKMIKEEIENKKAMLHQLENNKKEWDHFLTDTQRLAYKIGIAEYTSEIAVLEEYINNAK